MTDAHTGGDSVVAPAGPFIAAQPNWTAHVAQIVDGETVQLSSLPIVAWKIVDRVATPITVASIAGGLTLIESPSPARFFDSAREFSGVASWLDALLDGRKRELSEAAVVDPLA